MNKNKQEEVEVEVIKDPKEAWEEFMMSVGNINRKKVNRVKLHNIVSAGVCSVLPGNRVKPEVEIFMTKEGLYIWNIKKNEFLFTPYSNVIEVVFED